MSTKALILEANEHIKSAAILLEKIYKEIEYEYDPALVENTNIALSELMKGIKYLALVQGDITGNEILPRETRVRKTPEQAVN